MAINIPLAATSPAALCRSARSKRIVIVPLEHRVQLPPSDTHIAAIEDRQRECILQQATKRRLVIIALDTDHANEICNHAHSGLGTENLGLDCELFSRRRLSV